MSKSYKRTVTKVIDGDTFEIGKAIDGIVRIRLSDVDTPEIGEKGYEKMTEYLKKLVLGKKVKLVIKSKDPKKGNFQARWVCYVYYGLLYKKYLSEKVQKEMDKKPLWKKILK